MSREDCVHSPQSFGKTLRPPPYLFGAGVTALFHLFCLTTLAMIHITFSMTHLSWRYG